MRVLVGCEYSGIVRDAFLARGHDAVSCDIEPTESEGPHIQEDIFTALRLYRGWDLIIVHPPCTALAVSGNGTYANSKARHKAIVWTSALWLQIINRAPFAAMENPVGVLPFPADQYIQPWEYGHPESKKTGLWLHNLPLLVPTHSRPENIATRIHDMGPSPDRGKLRSRFYEGIADAMADQWACPVAPQKRLFG
jgi:hypothetical protein